MLPHCLHVFRRMARAFKAAYGPSSSATARTSNARSQDGCCLLQIVKEHGCQNVVDFGCGEGTWIKMLMFDPEQTKVTSVLGVDESPVALQRGSQLMSTVQLQCRQQEELKGKVLPAVKLCEVRLPYW